MTCEQTETLLAQLASGDTPASVEEAALMDDATAHVATCDRCREKLADYRITLKLLTDAFAAEDAACGLAPLTLSAERKENLLKRLSSPLAAELARTSGGAAPVPDPLSADEGRFNIRNYLRPLGVAASFGLVALGAWGLVDALAPNYGPLSAKSESPVATAIDSTHGGTLIWADDSSDDAALAAKDAAGRLNERQSGAIDGKPGDSGRRYRNGVESTEPLAVAGTKFGTDRATDGWREGRDVSGKLGDTLDRDGDAIADHRRFDRQQQNGQAPAEPTAPQATGAFAGLPGERGGQAGGAGGAGPGPGGGSVASEGRTVADGTMKNDRASEFFFEHAPAPESAAATPAPGNAPRPAGPQGRSNLGLGYVRGEKESGTPDSPSLDPQRFAGLADAKSRSMRGVVPGEDGRYKYDAEGGESNGKGVALAAQPESHDDRTVAFADEAKREQSRPMTRSGLERQRIAAGEDAANFQHDPSATPGDRPTRQPAKPAAPPALPPLVRTDLISARDAAPAPAPATTPTPVTPVTPAAPDDLDDLAPAQSDDKPMSKKQLPELRKATEEQLPAGKPADATPAPAPGSGKHAEHLNSQTAAQGQTYERKQLADMVEKAKDAPDTLARDLSETTRNAEGDEKSIALLNQNRRAVDKLHALKIANEAGRPTEDDAESDKLPAASNFKAVPVNPFVMTEQDRQSTFGLDTDTASYALVRKYVRAGFGPPAGAVRMEEFVNAFDYNYPTQGEKTFTVHAEAGAAPYGEGLALVKIGVKAKTVGRDARKPAHLVFVIDASGSMDRPDRLPLVKHSLGMLVRQLGPEDRVSIVAYGTHSITVEEAEPASNHEALLAAIGSIQAGGSTNMIEAVGKGYDIARNHFEPGQINRVILCSDGVANVGATDAQQMLDKVAANRRQGITLTNVGFGIGGYNDALMTDLAKKGDGNYVFVDTAAEAKRLFVDNLASTLQTVAKDAKIQVEFDPARVRRYRLIGYERRDIADKDFRNDAVDAGEVGSGQSATALYEVELLGDAAANLPDIGTVAVRYRNADTNEIEEISYRLSSDLLRQRTVKSDPRFYLAASAAEYAELLRGSEHASGATLERVEQTMAQVVEQLPLDRSAAELLDLVRTSKGLPAAP